MVGDKWSSLTIGCLISPKTTAGIEPIPVKMKYNYGMDFCINILDKYCYGCLTKPQTQTVNSSAEIDSPCHSSMASINRANLFRSILVTTVTLGIPPITFCQSTTICPRVSFPCSSTVQHTVSDSRTRLLSTATAIATGSHDLYLGIFRTFRILFTPLFMMLKLNLALDVLVVLHWSNQSCQDKQDAAQRCL